MWSKVDHGAVFVGLGKAATNQFTVESFLKSGCRGVSKSPTNRWAYISWNDSICGIVSVSTQLECFLCAFINIIIVKLKQLVD